MKYTKRARQMRVWWSARFVVEQIDSILHKINFDELKKMIAFFVK